MGKTVEKWPPVDRYKVKIDINANGMNELGPCD
jgi:hypothetical protein